MTSTVTHTYSLPLVSRLGALAGGALAMLSACAVAIAAATNSPPAWFTFSFEITILVAGFFALMIGLGRWREAPALGLLCCVGAVAVGSLLGFLGAGRVLQGVNLTPLLLGRGALTALILLAAGLGVIARRPGHSIRDLALAVAMLLPAAAIAVGAWTARATISGWHTAAIGFVIIGGFLAVLGFVAAATHFTIRAFEHGR